MRRILFATSLTALIAWSAPAQLAITETMSSASTNSGTGVVVQGPDFWELSNFGTNTIDLTDYIFNDSDATRGGDADTTTLSGVTIAPGESIVLVQSGTTVVNTRDDFINWWGASNLPADLQVLFYTGNGQSGSGDSIVLWSPTAASDADYVDRADYGEAVRGHTFTYDTNTGAFGIVSSNGIAGAFKAVTADDEGSPGKTAGPVSLAITQQPTPSALTIPAGSDATFTAAAQGFPHPHYQWRLQGTNLPGEIQPTLTIHNAQTNNAGPYSVVVANGLQTRVSSNAVLTVTIAPVAPTFATSPKSADAYIGQTVQFTALANGSPSPSYQWRSNSVDIAGATTAQLTFSDVQTNASAVYTVVAFNTAGTNSVSATLQVSAKPVLLITEVQSSEASPAGAHADWWELTSFDTRPIHMLGWRWDDNSHSLAPGNAYVFTNDVVIHPGESIVFVENITAAAFRAWWGTNLPPGLQIVTYIGNGLGLSATADEVNLWNAVTLPGSELFDRIAGVNFASSAAGVTFVYDPENPPVSGVMGVASTTTTAGTNANGVFVAAQSGDIGSPGYVVGPVRVRAAVSGANATLNWNSVASRTYTVEYRTNLASGSWISLTNFVADAPTAAAHDNSVSPQKFYRAGTVVPIVSEP
jgi:hypothetical protein